MNYRFNIHIHLPQTLLLAFTLLSGSARADQLWTNDTGNFSWDDTSPNWSGAAWTPGANAAFGGPGLGTINVAGQQSVGNLTFTAAGYTLEGGMLSMAGNFGVFGGASATVDSAVSSSGILVLDSSYVGQMTFGGAVNVAGFQVNGGTAIINGTLNSADGYFYVGNGDANNGGDGPNSNANTMIIGNAAQVNITGNLGDAFVIGRDSDQGTVTQNGGALNFNPGNGSSLLVAAGPTTGTYNMNGGTLNVNGNLLGVGSYGGKGSFNQSAGLITAGGITVGMTGGNGILLQSGGTITTGNLDLQSGTVSVTSPTAVVTVANGWNQGFQVGDGAAGTFNLSAGLITVHDFTIGTNGGTGVFNQSGGTINSSDFFSTGLVNNGTATYNMTGGVFNEAGDFTLCETSNQTCAMYQSGGVVNLNGNNVFVGRSTVGKGVYSISGGTLNQTSGGGNVQIGGANAGAAGEMDVSGSGSVSIAAGTMYVGNNSTPGVLTVSQSGSFSANNMQLGLNGGTGTIVVSGGQFTLGNGSYLAMGLGGGNATASVYMLGGAMSLGFLSVHENSTAASSTFYQTGGTVTMNSTNGIDVGRSGGGTGYYSMSGGLFNVGTNDLNLSIDNYNGNSGETGVLNLSGGSIVQSGIYGVHLSVDGNSNSTVNQTGGFLGISSTSIDGLGVGWNGSSQGTYNLAGGVLRTNKVQSQAGANGTFNFNGGTLQADANNADFMQGLTSAVVQSGGAVIDTNGRNITIAQPLVAPNVSDSGAVTIAVTSGGSGYVAPPTVMVSGGSGTPATAIANLDGNGHVASITIANPGDYTNLTNVAVNFSGGFGTAASGAAAAATVNFANLTSGGLTKVGSGALTLTAANTYTGNTAVNAGTLCLNGVNATASITVAGGAALSGTGSAPAATVNVAAGGTLDFSQNAGAVFAVGGLNFAGGSAINVGALADYVSNPVLSAGTISASNSVAINANLGSTTVLPGTYDLIGYGGSIGGSGSAAFHVAISGLGSRQTATVVDSNNQIDIVVSGATPYWNGTASDWLATNAWTLQPSNTLTTYQAGDADIFDDANNIASNGNVSLNRGNIAPASVTFLNNALAYSLSGSYGITGTSSLAIIGGGVVTISDSNSYSGGTILNAGALNVNNASALGSGPLSISGGTIDNTSGASVTLSTNNPQTWSGSFTFQGSNPLNLGAGAVTVSGSLQTVTVSGSTLTVDGPISAANSLLTVSGGGVLALTGNNTIGATNVTGGVLISSGSSSLGPTTVNNATLLLSGNNTLGATAVQGNGSLVAAGNTTFAGLQANGGGTVLVSGSVNVASGYFYIGNGGTNNGAYDTSGTMTINSGATLNVTGNLGDNFVVGRDSGSGVVNQNGGLFNYNPTNGDFFVGASNNAATSATYNMNGGTLNLNGKTLDVGFGAGAGASGAMNQAGGIVANAGTLKVGVGIGGGTYNLTGGQVTVGAGGIVGASSYTINLGGGTVAAAANWSSAAAMTLTGINGNATFDTTGGSISLSGPLSGAGGLQKVGPGVLSLTASATFAGPTIVAGGTLKLAPGNLPGGTVAYYNFSNPGNLGFDASGNGNNLVTGTGSPTYSASGVFGDGALSLDGASTLVANAFPTGVPTGGSPFTIAVWEQSAPGNAANAGFVGWGTNSNNETNNLRLDGPNAVSDYFYNNDLVANTSANLMDGTWHFIVATYDGTTETIYADGTPLSPSRTNFTAPNVQAANFVVGKTTADVNFTGLLDDLLIANTALSSAQIAALYNSGVGNGGSSNILPATTALKVASGGTLDLNGAWQQVASLSDAAPGSGGSIINSNLEAPAVLTISPTGGSTTFSGSIEGGGTLGSLGLVLSGPGTLVLSGSNSYEGGTTVAEGTLIVATGGALPTGTSLTVGAGGTFVFDPSEAGTPLAQAAAESSANGVAAVPEPGAIALLLAALGIAMLRRRLVHRRRSLG